MVFQELVWFNSRDSSRNLTILNLLLIELWVVCMIKLCLTLFVLKWHFKTILHLNDIYSITIGNMPKIRSSIHRILNPKYSFTLAILDILDPALKGFAPGSCWSWVVGRKFTYESRGSWVMRRKPALGTADLGICTGKLPWDPGNLELCPSIISWILQILWPLTDFVDGT